MTLFPTQQRTQRPGAARASTTISLGADLRKGSMQSIWMAIKEEKGSGPCSILFGTGWH